MSTPPSAAHDAMTQVHVPDIRHSTKIRATPERVFELLSSGDNWDRWFTDGSDFEPVAGSDLRLVWTGWTDDGSDMVDRGHVVVCEPNRRFVMTWGTPPSTVSFELRPHRDGTWLEVHESGLPQTPSGFERFAECSTGWGEALTLLRCFAEHGIRLST